MKRLIVVVFVIVAMAIPSLVIADEKVIEVSRTPWGVYFELVINDGKAYLRTHLQEFIDRNNGSAYAGKTVARVSLMGELVRLTKTPDQFVKTESGYTISFSAMVRANPYYTEDGYVVIDLGAAEVDGKKIKIL